jgi:Phage late-transcription coactivator
MEDELKNALELKFLCSSKFSELIEDIVKNNPEMNYIDAIVYYCEQHNLDIESITKLISKPLKDKLRCDATNLNYLKRTSKARLVL